MPDLIITAFWKCDHDQNFEIASDSNPDKVYKVHVQGWDVSCECMDWLTRGRQNGRNCKHIKAAIAQGACQWNELLDGGQPKKRRGEPVCPNCGGPLTSFREAV